MELTAKLLLRDERRDDFSQTRFTVQQQCLTNVYIVNWVIILYNRQSLMQIEYKYYNNSPPLAMHVISTVTPSLYGPSM